MAEIERRGLLQHVEERGRSCEGPNNWSSATPRLAGTRLGLLQGVVLQESCSCCAAQLAAAAIDQRLLLVAAGPRVLRMVPLW